MGDRDCRKGDLSGQKKNTYWGKETKGGGKLAGGFLGVGSGNNKGRISPSALSEIRGGWGGERGGTVVSEGPGKMDPARAKKKNHRIGQQIQI